MGLDLVRLKHGAETLDEAARVLGKEFVRVMCQGTEAEITLTSNAQPAILCYSVALLRSLNERCDFALGHSLGDTALVAGGSLEFADALKLVRARGSAMQAAVQGIDTCMKAIIFDPKQPVLEILKEIRLKPGQVADVANYNSTSQIVLSGTVEGVDYVSSILSAKGIASRALKLPVSAAFHSCLMKPAQNAMVGLLAETRFSEPEIPVISNVTAEPIKLLQIRQLLARQVTETVLWDQSVKYVKRSGVSEWTVVGPSMVLLNLLKKLYPADKMSLVTAKHI